MSYSSNPLGLPVGPNSGAQRSIVPGAEESGFKIPTSETAGQAGAGDAASGATQAPLVAPAATQSAAATEDSQAGPVAQTLGQEYDRLSEGRRQNYASLYNSYFG
jgi:hypothetical protein